MTLSELERLLQQRWHAILFAYLTSHCRGAGRVSGQGGQNSARSAEKFFSFAHPGFQFAHPAHRTEADLREKASLATNQEGPLHSPSVWPSLTVKA